MTLESCERLVVAADYKPEGERGLDHVMSQCEQLCLKLSGTGVTIKFNSALRAFGHVLVDMAHAENLGALGDYKLDDIPETLAIDGALQREVGINMLTAKCTAGPIALRGLKAELPDTLVFGVTVLTSFDEDTTNDVFGCSIEWAVERMARIAKNAGIDGLVASVKEVPILRKHIGDSMRLLIPGIRPEWASVKGDDQNQNRIGTPEGAIRAGADYIVIGRPITQSPEPYEAAMRTIEEIEKASK